MLTLRACACAPDGLAHSVPPGVPQDRLALAIVEDGESKGLLKPGATIVEATGPTAADFSAETFPRCDLPAAEFPGRPLILFCNHPLEVITRPGAGQTRINVTRI